VYRNRTTPVECTYIRLADLLPANAENHPSLSRLVRPPTRLDNGPFQHYKSRPPSAYTAYTGWCVLGCRRYTPSERFSRR